MAKNGITRSIKLPQPSVFGRIGTGIGKGLAESFPQELERGRLAHGLQNLSQQEGLSPFQQFSALASIPGVTPQMIQSGSELLKQQALRQSFANAANRPKQRGSLEAGGIPAESLTKPDSNTQLDFGVKPNASPKIPSVELEGSSLPTGNPLRDEVLPAKPWSQDRWLGEMADAQELYPNMTHQELMEYVDKKQQRELAAPEAQRAIDDYKESIQEKANAAFDSALSQKLQKTAEGTFADVPGTTQNKLKRMMINELVNNPKSNIKDVADKYSDLAFRRSKAINAMKVDSTKGFFSKSPSEVVSNLKSYAQIFKNVGDSENYKDSLIDQFKFSPQRASQVAFPESKQIKNEYLSKISRTSAIPKEMTNVSIKRANDLLKYITPSDSVQGIARSIKDKDPYFREDIFFQELKDLIADDERNNPFTNRQKEEISQGSSDVIPNWADLWYFPIPHGFSTGAKK